MSLIKWTNTERVLAEEGPVLVEKYKEFSNTSFDVTFQVQGLELTLNLPPYAQFIEEGRGPGKYPPPDAISNWIKVKRIVPREVNGITPTVDQLSYLIGRKIAEEGTEGKHALEKTWAEVVPEFKDKIKQAMLLDVKTEVRGWFNLGPGSQGEMKGI